MVASKLQFTAAVDGRFEVGRVETEVSGFTLIHRIVRCVTNSLSLRSYRELPGFLRIFVHGHVLPILGFLIIGETKRAAQEMEKLGDGL